METNRLLFGWKASACITSPPSLLSLLRSVALTSCLKASPWLRFSFCRFPQRFRPMEQDHTLARRVQFLAAFLSFRGFLSQHIRLSWPRFKEAVK